MTPDRNHPYIFRNNYSPSHHLTSEISSLTRIFYDNMKVRDKKRKHQSRTMTPNDIPESELVCVPADICAICCETDATPNLFRSTCGHVFHKNCLQRWCDHNDTCPNCRSENPFGYAQLTPYDSTRRTLNFGVNVGFVEEVSSGHSYVSARQEINESNYEHEINEFIYEQEINEFIYEDYSNNININDNINNIYNIIQN